MKKKVWDITVKDNPNRVVMGENDEFYTTDTEAYLVFKLGDDNFSPATAALTLENSNDGSLKNETVDVVDGLIEWEMPQRYIEHFGNWHGQLVYEDTKGGQPELYTSAPFSFVVNAHIGDKKQPSLVEIENWGNFIRDGTELIETWEDMEDLRQANEAQRQADYQELLDTGVLQTNINTKLEVLEEEYAPKLTEVATQLATPNPLTSRVANASIPLQIKTYDGNNQAVHPKVLYFENGWNGWNYWMAYTPYPFEDAEKENPSIAVSNDNITWTTPTGLVNPIDIKPSGSGLGVYLSDTHLVYDEALQQLEIWYRKVDNEATVPGEYIYRKKSTDGVNWGERELLHFGSFNRQLSPTAIKSGGVYQIWVIDGNYIAYYTSSTGTNWNFEHNITVESELDNYTIPWHLDVIKTDLGYEMLLQLRVDGGGYKDTHMFYTKSENNVNYDEAKLLISNGVMGNFDDYSIYRASLIKTEGVYTVYYTGVSRKNEWRIGVSQSVEPNNIFSLHGMGNTGVVGDIKAGNVVADKVSVGLSFLGSNRLKLGAKSTGATFMINDNDLIGRVQLKDGNGGQYGRLEVGSVVFKRDEEYPGMNQDGQFYYNKQSKLFDYIDGVDARHFQPIKQGFKENRPTGSQMKYGMMYYDNTLNKPIFYSAVNDAWVDAMGNLV